jgi:hypothetical protein
VHEYAKWLGMDLEGDKELLWIAREGLKVGHAAALGWADLTASRRGLKRSPLPAPTVLRPPRAGTPARKLEAL